jgi:TonB-dependent receptor
MNRTIRIFIITTALLISKVSVSQTSTIKGLIQESIKKEAVQGATVTLIGENKVEISGTKGEFAFTGLTPGVYSISIKLYGFLNRQVDSIRVGLDETKNIGVIFLQEKTETKKGHKVIYRKPQTTVAAGVKDQQKSETITNVITSASIAKSNDGDAAKVAARVPGVTLMENRFIMLRGLSQRYNSVQINNINAPSTEVDKRAFSFDLVPSNMLDKMSIYKSPSSDLAGDFAGGVIKLLTKSEIEKNFVSYSLGVGFRLNTTFSSHLNNNVSATDYFGFDNGSRALPSAFPSSLAAMSSSQNIAYGKMFNNNYALSNFRSPLDFGAGFGFGQNIKFKKEKYSSMSLYTVNNFSYSTSYQFSQMKRYRYQNDPTNYVQQMFNYTDDNLSIESKFNLLSNWIFRVNSKSTFTFKNIYNQIGENETTIRTGVNPTERPNDEWKNYSFHYTARSMYFGQFEGNHKIGKDDKLVYTLGYSNIKRNEPDFRRFRTVRAANANSAYTLVDPPSANLFDAARFFSDLKENTYAVNVNYETKFDSKFDSINGITLRFGTYAENKSRTFAARWFGFVYSGNPALKNDFLQTPIDQIFSSENINSTSGLKPSEGTNPSDKYTAQNNLICAYVNSSIPFNKFNVNLGVRTEYFQQGLKSAIGQDPVNINLTNLNILPSFNAAYYFDKKKKNQMRLAYGKTVNRPEFRELAPFVYYDFMYDVNIVGNPDLKICTIDNLDLRFENYPSSSETFSLGVFYKRFVNPIENFVQPIGLSQQFQLKNALSASNMGAELEFRKSFENSTQNKQLKRLSFLINASYIISKVDLGDDKTLSQARTRPLQGQSPYIFNVALQYKTDSGLSVNVAYNIYGKRIVYVGNNIFPTVYEMPRHSLDLTITKEISKRISIKFGVSDILNYKNRLWQDTNGDNKIDYKKERTDQELLSFRRGQMFNFSFSYKINEK